ncbi:MAG: hypothetical protein ABSA62_04200 [Methyloceanibacter sp.]
MAPSKRLDRAADGLCLRPRSPTLWRHRQPLHALTLLIARQVTHELESLDGSIDYHVVPPLCP